MIFPREGAFQSESSTAFPREDASHPEPDTLFPWEEVIRTARDAVFPKWDDALRRRKGGFLLEGGEGLAAVLFRREGHSTKVRRSASKTLNRPAPSLAPVLKLAFGSSFSLHELSEKSP